MQDQQAMGRRDLGIALALVVSTLVVYAQVGGHEFVSYDDPDYVTRNVRVQAGLSLQNVVWAFTTFHGANWFPLTWLSLMLDCTLFGPDPGALHLVNLAFHVFNTLLVYGLLRRLTGAQWRSALGAALFALHPLHVESVAWVTERKDVLSTAFGLLSILAYTTWAQRGGRWRYLACLGCLGLGLLSKQMLVTWPGVFLLLDYWPLARVHKVGPLGEKLAALRPLLIEKLPFFALVILFSAATLVAQGEGGAVVAEVSLPARLANAVLAYVFYLVKTVWPVGLAPFYPHVGERVLGWQAVGALALLVAATAVVLGPLRARRYLGFGWLFYLGTLVPVIGVVQVGLQSAADRYTYVPLLGIFVAVAWGLGDLVSHRPALRPAVVALALGWVAALAALSHAQVARWRDSLTLLAHTVAVTPSNPVSETLYGMALVDSGRVGDGMARFRAALEQAPSFGSTLLALGTTLLAQGRVAEANELFETAVARYPDWEAAHLGLGQGRLAAGDLDGALAAFRRAIELDPELAPAHNGAGAVLLQQGHPADALARFEEALRLWPGYTDAAQNIERARRAKAGSPSASE